MPERFAPPPLHSEEGCASSWQSDAPFADDDDPKSHSWLIADVHLPPERPDHPLSRAFEAFLRQIAGRARALYVLGDLFDRWVGDDLGLQEYAFILEGIRRCIRQGTEIKLLYGNRDFLMRDAFWDATGIQPLPEVSLVRLHGHNVILCHGDELCTRDAAYQKMRQRLRQRWVQWLLLKMPPERRRNLGQRLRQRSLMATAEKAPELMQADDDTVVSWFGSWPDHPHLIHGHTHRPGHHCYPRIKGMARHRWVVGDWSGDGAWVMRVQRDALALQFFSPRDDLYRV